MDTEKKPAAWLWRFKKPLAFALLILLAAVLALRLSEAGSRERELSRQVELLGQMVESLEKQKAEQEKKDSLIQESAPIITTETVVSQLNAIQELVTQEYIYRNAGKYENTLNIRGLDIPFTQKSFLVAYDGTIKAGVDLSQARIEVNEEGRTITISLPKGEIISNEIPPESIEIFDERNGLFNRVTLENYNEFVASQRGLMEQKATDSGLIEKAEQEARASVEAFLSLLPGMDTYKLTVK